MSSGSDDHNYSVQPFVIIHQLPQAVHDTFQRNLDYAATTEIDTGLESSGETFPQEVAELISSCRKIGGKFSTLASSLTSHYGYWRLFEIEYPDVKCRLCSKIIPFTEPKRIQNLAQHNARRHPKELQNGEGLASVDRQRWVKTHNPQK